MDKIEAYQREIEELKNKVARMNSQLKMVYGAVYNSPRDVRCSLYMSVSEICHRYQIQNCHVCEAWECCDNRSSARKEIERLRGKVHQLIFANNLWKGGLFGVPDIRENEVVKCLLKGLKKIYPGNYPSELSAQMIAECTLQEAGNLIKRQKNSQEKTS